MYIHGRFAESSGNGDNVVVWVWECGYESASVDVGVGNVAVCSGVRSLRHTHKYTDNLARTRGIKEHNKEACMKPQG